MNPNFKSQYYYSYNVLTHEAGHWYVHWCETAKLSKRQFLRFPATFTPNALTMVHCANTQYRLGLAHTFEGGCDTEPKHNSAPYESYFFVGDGVLDTNPHVGGYGPPGDRCFQHTPSPDDCGGGPAPVNNHMDYIPDVCRENQ